MPFQSIAKIFHVTSPPFPLFFLGCPPESRFCFYVIAMAFYCPHLYWVEYGSDQNCIILIYRKLIFHYVLKSVNSISNSLVTSIKWTLSLALSQFLLQINPVSVFVFFFLVTSAGNTA